MIIVLKQSATPEQTEDLRCWIRCHDLDVQTIMGEHQNVLVVIGDAGRLDGAYIEDLDTVEYVKSVSQPYKLAGRTGRAEDTVVNVGGVKIGGGNFAIIAGPCSVESSRQMQGIAAAVKDAGAAILRGGVLPFVFVFAGKRRNKTACHIAFADAVFVPGARRKRAAAACSGGQK